MLKITISAIFSLYMMTLLAQPGGSGPLSVIGHIKDSNMEPIAYCHIQVKSRNEYGVGDYYGNFRLGAYAGDTLLISAVSYHHALLPIPSNFTGTEFLVEVIMQSDTVHLKELVIYPWPSTFTQLKKEFMELEIEDPIANLNLHLPSPQEMRNLARPEGGISVPGPIGLLYSQFSREARSKRVYAELQKKAQAERRYNVSLVAKITKMKDEDEIKKFIDFCDLQIRFILDATDYELYAAIMDCYGEYCKIEMAPIFPGE